MNNVSRETFDSRATLARLLRVAQQLGHLGPGDVEEHIDHAVSQVYAAQANAGERWCDLGSGAGLPGLVMACLVDAEILLIDRSAARCDFLRSAAEQIVEERGHRCVIRVVEGDATEVARLAAYRGTADGVCARAFGPPSALAECAAPLLKVGGWLVVSEPPTDGHRWSLSGLNQLGLGPAILSSSAPKMAVMVQETACSERYPRRWARIKKQPLF
jgi:16S rRNA G527 N7-methylase RsmG